MHEVNLIDGRYRLDARIGHGAAGDVWRAHDVSLGRDVAVKTMRLGQGSSDLVLGRFRREVDAAAALNHPNVVSLHDAGRDDQTAYLVMELLDGPSTADLVAAEGPLPLEQGLVIGEQVARGLVAAHASGIVHRDIKPANVVFHDGVVKIVDFGIARLTEGNGETLTETGFTTGTAAYLSPEQARGDQVDAASDVYSLGCLLVALFTGQPPFPRDLPVAQALAHLTDEPPRLTDRRPDLPEPLADVVAAMLAKDPAERPTAAQVADALAALRTNDPTVVLPTPATAPRRAVAPLPPHRGRRGVLIAAAASLVAALTLGGSLLLPRDDTASTPPSPAGRIANTTPSASPVATPSAAAEPPVEASWTPVPTVEQQPAVEASAPATTTAVRAEPTRTSVNLSSVTRPVEQAIAGVSNPGGRRQLERTLSSLSSGITSSNADDRLDRLAATARDTNQLSPDELAAVLAAIDTARGRAHGA